LTWYQVGSCFQAGGLDFSESIVLTSWLLRSGHNFSLGRINILSKRLGELNATILI
jgi:hypothetical protein